MPFKSAAQMRGAFSGAFGPEMKARASEWAKNTPNIKSLPEHIPPKKERKIALKAIVKKHTGKGGPASDPADLLTAINNPYYKKLKYFKMLNRIAKQTNLG